MFGEIKIYSRSKRRGLPKQRAVWCVRARGVRPDQGGRYGGGAGNFLGEKKAAFAPSSLGQPRSIGRKVLASRPDRQFPTLGAHVR